MKIERADFDHPGLLVLLRHHLEGMHASSPPEAVHALDICGLKSPDLSLFVAKHGDNVVGMGGLKELAATSGELKSMRTHPGYLRQGIASALLDHLIAEARRRGYRHLGLETGRGEAFEPALALYRRYGFCNGPVFGDYTESTFSQFLHLPLS